MAATRMKLFLAITFAAVLLRAQQSGPVTLPARAANGAIVQQPRQPASFDCSADGTVVNAVTGEPILRAKVILQVAGTPYSATTDATGKWTLNNVGCAPVMLQVSRPGFLNMAPTQAKPIQLVSGATVHDIRTALTPQSVAIGKVLDDQGDPVQGVQITALSLRVSPEGRLRFQAGGSAMSNDIGEFRLANLQPGKYIFCSRAINRPEPREQMIAADSCYPGPPEAAASAIDVAAGREIKMDFNLTQVPAFHIRGSVAGAPEGRNVGINLQEIVPNADMNHNTNGPVRDGKFDVRVSPGSYLLSADYFEAGKHLTARVSVTVGNSDVDNLVVHLDEGFTVSGILHVDSQSNVAPPQFGINLRAETPAGSGGQMRWGADHATFTISDLVAGSFKLNASPPSPFYVSRATLAGQDILNNWVPISQVAGPIEVVLRDDGGVLEGDVVDASSQPTAATILVLRGASRIAMGYSGENGHFKIQNLPPGDYSASAWNDGNKVPYAEAEWMRRYATAVAPVTITAAQTTQVKLTQQIVPVQ